MSVLRYASWMAEDAGARQLCYHSVDHLTDTEETRLTLTAQSNSKQPKHHPLVCSENKKRQITEHKNKRATTRPRIK